ncbi:hypothetical protein [Paraburkholderia tagetis]|uniref:Uncharacterized protein n=1 Tax=Paraburkholderia tagetis TaxID=2913261 RepID=A0A9X1ZYT1_9BURK|nr:hypothetical protein [Paraburkholderia tagetis]MCG5077569.1 hypothetical protein [Paraburkholderia tagetis]
MLRRSIGRAEVSRIVMERLARRHPREAASGISHVRYVSRSSWRAARQQARKTVQGKASASQKPWTKKKRRVSKNPALLSVHALAIWH